MVLAAQEALAHRLGRRTAGSPATRRNLRCRRERIRLVRRDALPMWVRRNGVHEFAARDPPLLARGQTSGRINNAPPVDLAASRMSQSFLHPAGPDTVVLGPCRNKKGTNNACLGCTNANCAAGQRRSTVGQRDRGNTLAGQPTYLTGSRKHASSAHRSISLLSSISTAVSSGRHDENFSCSIASSEIGRLNSPGCWVRIVCSRASRSDNGAAA